MAETAAMLELKDLAGGWGSTVIIDGLSLRVDAGETVAIVGRNGAGKSTLMELVAGRARLAGGTILLAGVPLQGLPPHGRNWRGLAYVPQNREVFKSLTVAEHLDIAQRPGRWDPPRLWELFPSLGERAASLAGSLSGGEQQMLAIARALVANPRVMLLDEPSEGLAPRIVEHLVDAIRRITADQSMAVLLVEQRVDIALEISSRCLVMERGQITSAERSASVSELELARRIGLG